MILRDKWYVGKCVSPKITLSLLTYTIMVVKLEIKKASSVVSMSGCSKATENSCGIAYRHG